MNRIEPRSGVAFELPKGAQLTVCDPEGSQVSDLLAYNAHDVREVISNGRTFDYEETIRLGRGHRLWSNRSNPMLSDIVGCVASGTWSTDAAGVPGRGLYLKE